MSVTVTFEVLLDWEVGSDMRRRPRMIAGSQLDKLTHIIRQADRNLTFIK